MHRILVAAAGVTQLALCACAAPANEPERPAVLVAPDARVRAELRNAVSGALYGAQVTLADDAFTSNSVLAIERAPARDSYGRPLSGRELLGKPAHFHLVVSGARCVLVHDETGRRVVLTAATCREAP